MESKPKSAVSSSESIPSFAHEREISTPEEFLTTVDFETLNAVFDEVLERSGVPGNRQLIHYPITRDSISIVLGEEGKELASGVRAGGHTNDKTGLITLHWDTLSNEVSKAPLEAGALHVLTHEATHLRARMQARTVDPESEGHGVYDANMRYTRGYREVTFNSLEEVTGAEEWAAYSLNEAVTEEIAVEVLREYLQRTGNRKLIGIAQDHDVMTEAYTGDRMILRSVISALSKRVEIDTDTVWRAFVQGYFYGEQGTRSLVLSIMKELAESMPQQAVATLALYGNEHCWNPKEVPMYFSKQEELDEAIEHVSQRFSSDQLRDVLRLQ